MARTQNPWTVVVFFLEIKIRISYEEKEARVKRPPRFCIQRKNNHSSARAC